MDRCIKLKKQELMNYDQYRQLFDEILKDPHPDPPYHKESYMNYVRLNRTRMKRWDKQMDLDENFLKQLKQIDQPQHWVIITEPWCGDAAHVIPFLVRMAEENENITYDIQLRDSEPFLIEQYLNDGKKSIPRVIIRDEGNNDLFVWGPRPQEAQMLLDQMKDQGSDSESTKIALQNWFNHDKGISLTGELAARLFDEVVDETIGK